MNAAARSLEEALARFMSGMSGDALVMAMAGEVSLKRIAAGILSSRGEDPQVLLLDAYDADGKWIGTSREEAA